LISSSAQSTWPSYEVKEKGRPLPLIEQTKRNRDPRNLFRGFLLQKKIAQPVVFLLYTRAIVWTTGSLSFESREYIEIVELPRRGTLPTKTSGRVTADTSPHKKHKRNANDDVANGDLVPNAGKVKVFDVRGDSRL
jgi:hypothetical protein